MIIRISVYRFLVIFFGLFINAVDNLETNETKHYLVHLKEEWLGVIQLESTRFGFIYIKRIVPTVHLFEDVSYVNTSDNHDNQEKRALQAIEVFKAFFAGKIIEIEPKKLLNVKYRFIKEKCSAKPKTEYSPRSLERRSATQHGWEMGVQAVWNMGITGNEVFVAVVDNGVNIDHPSINRNITYQQVLKQICCESLEFPLSNENVKYAYQELPQSEDTASPHSQEDEKKRAWLIKRSISKQTPQTINKNENQMGYRLGTNNTLSMSFVDEDPTDIKPQRFWNYIFETDKITSHGSKSAGLIAGEYGSGYCPAGVAINAKFIVLKVFSTQERIPVWITHGFPYSGEMLSAALEYKRDVIDIYSCSFNRYQKFKKITLDTKIALKNGVEKGRNGLGSIFVFSSGNRLGQLFDCNIEAFASSEFTIAISSVGKMGGVPLFAIPCASTLASTYGKYKTFDGSEKLESISHDRRCDDFSGTSASASIASGIFALLLQANPDLSWRCIQHITVLTASLDGLKTEDSNLTNAVGHRYHHKFGFGLMNATAMVLLAKQWKRVPTQINHVTHEYNALTRYSSKNTIAAHIRYEGCSKEERCVNFVEQVLVTLSYTTNADNQLDIVLRAPSGTYSNLMTRKQTLKKRSNVNSKPMINRNWRFKSVHFWGENPKGSWLLLMRGYSDLKNDAESSEMNFNLISVSMNLFGTADYPYSEEIPPKTIETNETDQSSLFEDLHMNEILNHFAGTIIKNFTGPNFDDFRNVLEETTKDPTNYWPAIIGFFVCTVFIIVACIRNFRRNSLS